MQAAKAAATASSSNGSPKVAPPELEVDAHATVVHAPHASHPPTEAGTVLSAADWQAASQLSQMSQVPLLPNGAPEYSMFARSALEPADSSMAGGASGLPSVPTSEQGGDGSVYASVYASLPSMHGAVDSEVASMRGDDSAVGDSADLPPVPPTAGRLAPMQSLSSMHGGASAMGSASRRLGGEDSIMMGCPALGGMQGGPSALASMMGASSSLMGESGALGSMYGGPSVTVSCMGGEDSLMMPCPGRATRSTAAATPSSWYAPHAQHVLCPCLVPGACLAVVCLESTTVTVVVCWWMRDVWRHLQGRGHHNPRVPCAGHDVADAGAFRAALQPPQRL